MNTKIQTTQKERLHMKGDGKARVFSRVMIILYCLLIIYPIFFVILTSLKPTSEFYVNIWGMPKTWAFENYLTAWDTANIGQYMLNSVIIVAVVMVVTLLVSGLAGYALSRFKIKYAELIMMLILACTMSPSEAVIMPMYLLTSKLHLTGSKLALLIPYIGWGLPMSIYIFRNFFDTIPNERLEAARIDGAGPMRIYWSIVMPNIKPAVMTQLLFAFQGIWSMTATTGTIFSERLKTLPAAVSSIGAGGVARSGAAMAAAVLMLIPPILVYFISQSNVMETMSSAGIKE